ncbi:Rieske 2Fe-2S domain-containing protein [Antrihabitans sp. YC2-6]|uniref:Rieske 2Fe-2S domain-containing protein n=1 Tax=Antrihabitans sp. YC2-6 TaxID=2799498 RepID=UPI0018F66017|nr:Rieske 2Fe-2S domain-containing protein [Antrihabitans sp. YC2-6]MBJ8344681.1 Rieske 2Fe-2S domain-containing protein [Antrihabitans sp. YC2-6]
MAKTPLPMNPTGWFQVAWSAEVGVGEVRRMKYFDTELIAWRSATGEVAVMDAFCEHLGAHLGYGGHVEGDRIVCPFHGWEWNREGRNVCVPYEKHPNKGRRIRSYPVAELNESIFMWHDVHGGAPYFDVPDVRAGFDDGRGPADYYPAYPTGVLFEQQLELHPQYVLENGVDFAHFKYVHKVPIVPVFTRHDFDRPVSYVDFTITFDDSTVSAADINSGVQAINAGLGVAATKSWGMIDNRTMSCVTPVDDSTSDVRFTVWIGRVAGGDGPEPPSRAKYLAQAVIDQFVADIHIWKHQRYSDPPALSRAEYKGFNAIREWATQFYPAN